MMKLGRIKSQGLSAIMEMNNEKGGVHSVDLQPLEIPLVHPIAISDLPDNENDRVVVVEFPSWRKQWSRWCFSRGRNKGRGGVSHGGRNGGCNTVAGNRGVRTCVWEM